MILLTGATGKTGGATAAALSKKNVPFRAIVRSAEKAGALKDLGADIVIGDLSDASLVEQAMAGVEKAVLIVPNSDQQLQFEKTFTDLAVKSGVKHLLKLSSMDSVPDAKGAIPLGHVESETYIQGSDLAWTMIRPNFFMQNFLLSAGTIKEQGKIFQPFGEELRTGMSDARDIGDVIAHVLTSSGHEGKSYDLTGPDLISFAEVAHCFSEALGKDIQHVHVPLDAYMEGLKPFLINEWHFDAVKELFAEIAEGNNLGRITNTVSELLGRPATSLKQFVEDHKTVFS